MNKHCWSDAKVKRYKDSLITDIKQFKLNYDINKLHVYISEPNAKGAPHSVSLLPIIDCLCCKSCGHSCYDMRHDMIYKSARLRRINNHIIARQNPKKYFREISGRCQSLDKFRWHIGGDILSYDYWCGMVHVANENPHCKFHVFTKCHNFINRYLDEGHTIPENINLRLSQWSALPINNPHNLNTARVVLENEFIETDAHTAVCNGNCSACAIHSNGCFNNNIKTILLPIH